MKIRNVLSGRVVATAAALGIAVWLQPAHAYLSATLTDQELALLPPWCNYTQTFRGTKDPSTYHAYVKKYGQAWQHMHHYCWAVAAMMRFERANMPHWDKRGYLKGAIDDINYVADRVKPDFAFYYEVVNRKARIYLRANQPEVAIRVAKDLVETIPGPVDGYATLADALIQAGRRGEAQQVLKQAEDKVDDKARLSQVRAALKL